MAVTERDQKGCWRGNLHVYFGPVRFDSRMFKITRSLNRLGFARKIYIAGIWEPGLAEYELLDETRCIRRFRLLTPRVSGNSVFQSLRIGEFSLRVLLFSFGKKIDLVNCHMLMLLPLCVLLKRLYRVQLVYEPREIESEQEGFTDRKKRFLKSMEARLLKHVDMVVHVGVCCAQWYEDTFGISHVYVLRNTPYAADVQIVGRTDLLRDRFSIAKGDMIFVWQGQLRIEGDIEAIMDAFVNCPDKTKHVVFIGFGPFQKLVEENVRRHTNIHFLPAVPQAELLRYTASADVGLCVLSTLCDNNRFANPNKINEYFVAGIPMIVSSQPEMAGFVQERECGWIVDAGLDALANMVGSISVEEVQRLRTRIGCVRHNFGWEEEEKTLVKIYDALWRRRQRT